MKNKKINPTYCLYVGETSIELSNGPVNYYAEALRIACDKYVCSIADEHNRKLAVFKKISSQEFVVTESYDIQAKKGRIGHHYFNKLVEVGDAFKKAEE
ncbi:MAG: hypothetical protein OHK0011_23910 [Turneriella sp.]